MIDPAPLSDAEQIALANMLSAIKGPVRFRAEYRNWRGEVANRRVEVREFQYGSTEYHPEPCLLLVGRDMDRDVERTFRVADFDAATICAIN